MEKNIPSVGEERSLRRQEEIRAPEHYVKPAVDIFETDENLTLLADLPGIEKENLEVKIDKGLLTIKGTITPAKRGRQILREFSQTDFYRKFELPREIDEEKMSAEFKDGVLNLTMPKSAAAKPKRIEITTH